jgi:hypothetical protein
MVIVLLALAVLCGPQLLERNRQVQLDPRLGSLNPHLKCPAVTGWRLLSHPTWKVPLTLFGTGNSKSRVANSSTRSRHPLKAWSRPLSWSLPRWSPTGWMLSKWATLHWPQPSPPLSKLSVNLRRSSAPLNWRLILKSRGHSKQWLTQKPRCQVLHFMLIQIIHRVVPNPRMSRTWAAFSAPLIRRFCLQIQWGDQSVQG